MFMKQFVYLFYCPKYVLNC